MESVRRWGINLSLLGIFQICDSLGAVLLGKLVFSPSVHASFPSGLPGTISGLENSTEGRLKPLSLHIVLLRYGGPCIPGY